MKDFTVTFTAHSLHRIDERAMSINKLLYNKEAVVTPDSIKNSIIINASIYPEYISEPRKFSIKEHGYTLKYIVCDVGGNGIIERSVLTVLYKMKRKIKIVNKIVNDIHDYENKIFFKKRAQFKKQTGKNKNYVVDDFRKSDKHSNKKRSDSKYIDNMED